MSHTSISYASDGSRIEDGQFQNLAPMKENAGITKIIWRSLTAERTAAKPDSPVPVLSLSKDQILEGGNQVYRLGHSTVLIKLDNQLLLTDPVFSDRASPVQWAGPKRFHPAPIRPEALPHLDAIVISHNHYDHLDEQSIQQLNSKTDRFLVPLGVGQHLRDWGVDGDKIIELDWWQSYQVGKVTLTATPAQHFSGRGLFDKDKTLWASWVFAGEEQRVFFSGDSGYFPGFKRIGEAYGPFDLTLIETGAYDHYWPGVHMTPEESLKAHQDLKGKAMLPVHNSTFDLAMHTWFEPLERIAALAAQAEETLITPRFGEAVPISGAQQSVAVNQYWWRSMIADRTLAPSSHSLVQSSSSQN